MYMGSLPFTLKFTTSQPLCSIDTVSHVAKYVVVWLDGVLPKGGVRLAGNNKIEVLYAHYFLNCVQKDHSIHQCLPSI